MIPDARPFLEEALPTYTDPVEIEGLTQFLQVNEPISGTLSYVDNKVVWLFAGPVSQIAIPVALVPRLTAFAREQGLHQQFYDTLLEEMSATLDKIRAALFVET